MPWAKTIKLFEIRAWGILSLFNTKISSPSSCPEASKVPFFFTEVIQYLALLLFYTIMSVFDSMFQTLVVLSSELLIKFRVVGSHTRLETLDLWPRIVECSQATSFVYFQSFIFLSSEPDAIIFCVGWNVTQLQPLSCPYKIFMH